MGRKRDRDCDAVGDDVKKGTNGDGLHGVAQLVDEPNIERVYDWHFEDWHTRVLNLGKGDNGKEAVVVDIASHSLSLFCIVKELVLH